MLPPLLVLPEDAMAEDPVPEVSADVAFCCAETAWSVPEEVAEVLFAESVEVSFAVVADSAETPPPVPEEVLFEIVVFCVPVSPDMVGSAEVSLVISVVAV